MSNSESGIVWVMLMGLIAVAIALGVLLVDARNDVDFADMRIGQLEERIYELECRHILYEDYSTDHEDGEKALACLRP